jgi:diketogulonate reductase-like aldo/keto reductase
MINKNNLSKIGIGTWGIGGFIKVNPNNDNQQEIESLIYTLKQDVNFLETVFIYAQGKATELLAESIKKSGVNRNNLFITLSIYLDEVQTTNDIKIKLEEYLNLIKSDYVDSIQFPVELFQKINLEEIDILVKKLLQEGKIRFTSLTNANLDFLKKYHAVFGNKLFAHETVFNFEIRENEKFGITNYAQDNGILNIVFQPLRRNRTAARNWPLLVELAKKYNKTQNQIILNWITSKGFLPLIKSTNIQHIDENLESFQFVIEPEDIKRLNNFEIIGYKTPKIDWDYNGDGITIDQLPNVFDTICPSNKTI